MNFQRKTVLALLGLCVVVGCAKAPTPNEQLAQQAEKQVSDSLKDPTSAKFKGVVASAKANCIYGKVLAKNSMGAYTGYHDFVWINGQSYIDNSAELTGLSSAGDLENLNSYVDNQGKCQNSMPHGTGPDREAQIPDA